jgi:transposase
MSRSKRAQYTLEFKIEAVRLVRGGQSVGAVSQVLGVAAQTLHNWVKRDAQKLLVGAYDGESYLVWSR